MDQGCAWKIPLPSHAGSKGVEPSVVLDGGTRVCDGGVLCCGGWSLSVDGLSTTDSDRTVVGTDAVGLLMVGRNLKSSTAEPFSLGFWTRRNF